MKIFEDFKQSIEGFISGSNLKNEKEFLPYKENYKKLDIVRDFSQVINDNFKLVNTKYFCNRNIEVDLILQNILIDILKQIFLGSFIGFEMTQIFEQKIKSMNIVTTYKTIMSSLEFLKKNIFK